MIKPSRLLVVDPNKAVVASMMKHFNRFGFLVQSAANGERALEIASRRRPDAFIVEIKLPDMSGFELWGRLHALPETADVPILLVGNTQAIESNQAGHAWRYHVDSIDLPALTKKIKALLAVHKRRKTIEELLARDGPPAAAEGAQELTVAEQSILRGGGAVLEDLDLGAEDPSLRGKTDYLNLLESSFTTAQASKLLGVNESRVRQRLTSEPPSLYGIKRGAEWSIPSFQFEGKRLVPNLERVIAKLDANLSPVSVWRWFTSPDAELVNEDSPEGGFSPRDWLLRGLPAEAVEELAVDLHQS